MMRTKRSYEAPLLDIIRFHPVDVITSSCEDECGCDGFDQTSMDDADEE